MSERKNEAKLTYRGELFLIWQDSQSNWQFTYKDLSGVNTSQKELQMALNSIYETIDEKLRPNLRKPSGKTPGKQAKPSSKPYFRIT